MEQYYVIKQDLHSDSPWRAGMFFAKLVDGKKLEFVDGDHTLFCLCMKVHNPDKQLKTT